MEQNIIKNAILKLFSSSSSPNHNHHLPSPPPSLPPPVFICPLCSLLMSHPVMTSDSHSFHHLCHASCVALNYSPSTNPDAHLSLPIPNITLRYSIFEYCHLTGHPQPFDLSVSGTLLLVKNLRSLPSPPHPLPPPSIPSSFSPEAERQLLEKLLSLSPISRNAALNLLIENRICSPRILGALAKILTSANGIGQQQKLAARAVHALCLDHRNWALVVRAGLVPAFVHVLDRGSSRAYSGVARALCLLTRNQTCRLLIAAMEMIPVLLDRLCGYFSRAHRAGREAAVALYRIVVGSEENCRVLVESGGVGKCMGMAGDDRVAAEMRRHALGLVHCMVMVEGGWKALLDEPNVSLLVRVLKEGEATALDALAVMYRVCRECLPIFRAIGAMYGFMPVLGEEKEYWGDDGRLMARAMVRVIRGEITASANLDEILVQVEQEKVTVVSEIRDGSDGEDEEEEVE